MDQLSAPTHFIELECPLCQQLVKHGCLLANADAEYDPNARRESEANEP